MSRDLMTSPKIFKYSNHNNPRAALTRSYRPAQKFNSVMDVGALKNVRGGLKKNTNGFNHRTSFFILRIAADSDDLLL